jgi:molybdate transport system substrate-binding protein
VAATPEPKELVVLAASSLTDAFTEMAGEFPKQAAGVKLTFSFGGSSQLRTQLEQGAPADVFASADTAQMDAAVKAGLLQGTSMLFASNRLVVVLPRDNRAGVGGLADLAKPGLKLVTTSRDVPVGGYTRQALERMAADGQYGAGFDRRVLANVVSEEANVRQVVTKVQLGEADAGICYATDVTPRVAADLRTIEIPDRFNAIAAYPIAVARLARAPVMAARFVQYVAAAPGQAILKKYGFLPVG